MREQPYPGKAPPRGAPMGYLGVVGARLVRRGRRQAGSCPHRPASGAPRPGAKPHRASQRPTEALRAPSRPAEPPQRTAEPPQSTAEPPQGTAEPPQNPTEPCRAPQSPLTPCRAPQSPTEPRRTAQRPTELHRTPQSPAEPCRAPSEPNRAAAWLLCPLQPSHPCGQVTGHQGIYRRLQDGQMLQWPWVWPAGGHRAPFYPGNRRIIP